MEGPAQGGTASEQGGLRNKLHPHELIHPLKALPELIKANRRMVSFLLRSCHGSESYNKLPVPTEQQSPGIPKPQALDNGESSKQAAGTSLSNTLGHQNHIFKNA